MCPTATIAKQYGSNTVPVGNHVRLREASRRELPVVLQRAARAPEQQSGRAHAAGQAHHLSRRNVLLASHVTEIQENVRFLHTQGTVPRANND